MVWYVYMVWMVLLLNEFSYWFYGLKWWLVIWLCGCYDLWMKYDIGWFGTEMMVEFVTVVGRVW